MSRIARNRGAGETRRDERGRPSLVPCRCEGDGIARHRAWKRRPWAELFDHSLGLIVDTDMQCYRREQERRGEGVLDWGHSEVSPTLGGSCLCAGEGECSAVQCSAVLSSEVLASPQGLAGKGWAGPSPGCHSADSTLVGNLK